MAKPNVRDSIVRAGLDPSHRVGFNGSSVDNTTDLAELANASSLAVPGLIRRAEQYILENAGAAITVSDVAAELGVSLRSLQAGFRQWRSTTPNLFLRRVRLQLVRDELRRLRVQTTVQAVAMRHGFSNLGRFSAYYHAAFGESPSTTLHRSRLPRYRK
jgi:AraC-like DNA-binding protein